MTSAQDNPNPVMAISDVQLKLEQVQAAMKAMMDRVNGTSETPVVMAIVDAAGNLEAFGNDGRADTMGLRSNWPSSACISGSLFVTPELAAV